MCAMHPSSSAPRFPAWEREYEAVLTETDIPACFKRLEVAEAAVRSRRALLASGSDDDPERRAIEKALVRLDDIKRNRLRFR